MIRELERMDRGRYAGPVGWVDAAGNGEWGIALRCAALDGPRARLFAGCGIFASQQSQAGREPFPTCAGDFFTFQSSPTGIRSRGLSGRA